MFGDELFVVVLWWKRALLSEFRIFILMKEYDWMKGIVMIVYLNRQIH